MKITAGRFHRIPNKYSDNLQNAIKSIPSFMPSLTLIRSMLQVDSSKRPRIEDLTNLPALQPALRQSNLIIKEAQMNLVRSYPCLDSSPPSQSYSTKWRELKSREIALNEKEENLRRLEEQLNTREKSLLAREKRIQSAERQSITSLPHQQKVGVRRSNSLPVATVIPPPNILYEQTIEESEEEGEENRRMSLQMDDPIPICEPDQPRGWIPTTAAPQPFKIYSEESTEPNPEAKRDEFTNGVARARELLNRPRLMTRNSDYYPSGATGSTFYKNYLANKKASEVGQGIENIKPASMIFEKNKNQVGGVGNGNGGNDGAGNGCGSATKRSRKEYETMENGNEGKGVPSVQVDLHSLMMAGRGKFDNL